MDQTKIAAPPRFKDYGRRELRHCGERFVVASRQFFRGGGRAASTGVWTDFVLDWFWGTRAEAYEGKRVTVDASRSKSKSAAADELKMRTCHGEFLADMVHSTYPPYGTKPRWNTVEYWEEAIENPCKLLLALESEMGTYGNQGGTFIKVMEDAAKLPALRAKMKVMVFASHKGTTDQTELLAALKKLRARSDDPAPWLCVDLPWEEEAAGKWNARAEVLSGRSP